MIRFSMMPVRCWRRSMSSSALIHVIRPPGFLTCFLRLFGSAAVFLALLSLTPAYGLALTNGVPSPGTIGLLLPDGTATTNPQVMSWLDAADEEGLRVETLTDTQFLALGNGSNAYRGIILPDQVHVSATDALIAAIQGYVTRGGQVMLVYDFGALTPAGAYAVPKSRLSSLAGVDYLLYDELRDRTTGLGPLTGFESILRQWQVPPGKSMLFTSTASPLAASSAATSGAMLAAQLDPTDAKATATRIGVLKGANLAANQALYLPSSPANPGGVIGYDHAQQFRGNPYDAHVTVRTEQGLVAAKISTNLPVVSGSKTPALKPVSFNATRKLTLVDATTPLTANMAGVAKSALATTESAAIALGSPAPDPVHAVSGYIYGVLTYPSFVTRGNFAGLQLASAPQFGLAAGVNTVGSGKVLFVNLPVNYLKGSSDAMPMHGFLHYFANTMLKLPHLSSLPNALPGLTLNWHLCSNFTTDMAALTQQGVFTHGPFSIHITAGPDTVAFGDHLGWNLPGNPQAQQMLRSLEAQGHRIGNHGGWIHDYYGENVSETNQATFQQYLVLNNNAVDAALGHATIEYAAPQGNSPTWATDWIEQHGAIGSYALSHTGVGPTRNYIGGLRRNPALWLEPVMPLGEWATFDEFIYYGIPKTDVSSWYQSLIDFSIRNRTNRLIYMHPPADEQWSDVVLAMLNYAKTKKQAGKFSWYTIADMSAFMTTRSKIKWTEAIAANGNCQFAASHPTSLARLSWIFPKSAFAKPVITAGSANVSDGGDGNWLVVATSGTTLNFRATPL
ncbi:hypothetical protein RCH09_003412 [Actimicrobium sp. GrIS 1.19]|uniref:hypothetical protein n=1 Tax=Actimicrobium sp. GrIS 1.19 TaxID=3071708 RepID=UPI002E00F13F|nr:hypothetical protein [Actimicrobium sp. GrIS 1.19]